MSLGPRERGPRARGGAHRRVHAAAPWPTAARVLASVSVLSLVVAVVAGWLLWAARGAAESGTAVTFPPPAFSREFGSTGRDALVQPVGIAASDGRVYVADSERGDVVVYTAAGSLVATIGAANLSTPVYVAVGPLDGLLYVSDRSKRSVQVFETGGRFVRTFEPLDDAGKAAARGWQPLALAFGDDGTLYVSDVGSRQRVLAFGPTGRFLGETGADVPVGASGKTLSFVNGLAASGGRLFVADSNNSRVLVLGGQLRFERAAAFAGLPRGLTVLADGMLLVVDTTGSELRVLGADGATRSRAGAKGQESGQLLLPTAVASDGSGDVFVTDTGNRRVSVWRVAGAVRRDLFEQAASDPRWWGVAVAVLVGAASAFSAVMVGRNRRHAI